MNFPSRKLAAGAAIACLTLFSVVTGCKKSGSGSGSSMSATIAGSAFAGNVVIGVRSSSQQMTFITAFEISGKDSAALELSIPDSLVLNKAYLTGNGVSWGQNSAIDVVYFPKFTVTASPVVYDVNDPGGYGHGYMTILARDTTGHTIAGTFNGVLYNGGSDSVIISKIQFNTKYTQEP